MGKRDDDEDEFEKMMEQLGVKPAPKAARPARNQPAPPSVVEDVDFEAAMRELPDRPAGKSREGAKPVASQEAPGAKAAPAENPRARDPARYAPSAEEVATFLDAVEGGPVDTGADRGDAAAAPRAGTPDVGELLRRLRRGQLDPDALLDL